MNQRVSLGMPGVPSTLSDAGSNIGTKQPPRRFRWFGRRKSREQDAAISRAADDRDDENQGRREPVLTGGRKSLSADYAPANKPAGKVVPLRERRDMQRPEASRLEMLRPDIPGRGREASERDQVTGDGTQKPRRDKTRTTS